MQRPLVSVVIPTFNHGGVIADALRSAMRQDYENLEIVVLDNASEDDTENVVKAVSQGDNRVRYLRNERNLGMAGNFNACIAFARGDFIKFLCADDLLETTCVTEMVEAFEVNPPAILVSSARLLVDEEFAPLRILRYSRRTSWADSLTAIRRCFFRGNLIGEPTAVMFRRKDALRGFSNEYLQLMDLEMWIYLLKSGGMVYIDRPLCSVRIHPQQATKRHLKSGDVLRDKRRLFQEFQTAFDGATIAERLFWDFRMAITIFRSGEMAKPLMIRKFDGTVQTEAIYFRCLFKWLVLPSVQILRLVSGILIKSRLDFKI